MLKLPFSLKIAKARPDLTVQKPYIYIGSRKAGLGLKIRQTAKRTSMSLEASTAKMKLLCRRIQIFHICLYLFIILHKLQSFFVEKWDI